MAILSKIDHACSPNVLQFYHSQNKSLCDIFFLEEAIEIIEMLSVSVVNRFGVVAKDEKLRRDQSLHLFVEIIIIKGTIIIIFIERESQLRVSIRTHTGTQLFTLNNNKIIDTIY